MAENNERRRKIKLHLYDTDLSVTIPAVEEEYFRSSEKLIAHVMEMYSTHFKGTRSDKEIQYMALVDITVRYVKEQARHDGIAYRDILSKFTADIDDALSNT